MHYNWYMKTKNDTSIILKSVALAFEYIDLLGIYILLSIPAIMPSLFPNTLFSTVISQIDIIFTVVSIAFILSIPAFLHAKTHKKSQKVMDIGKIVFHNLRRILLPLLGMTIFYIALIFLFIIVAQPTPREMSRYVSMLFPTEKMNPFVFLFYTFVSFFQFTAIYFSLKNKGLLESMKLSIFTGLKNIPFLFGIICINSTMFLLMYLFVDFKNQYLIRLIINCCVGYFVSVLTYIYFEEVIEMDSKKKS